MTPEEIKNLVHMHQQCQQLEELAEDTAREYLKYKGWNVRPKNHAWITEVEFDDDDTFTFEFEGGCGCCPPDTYGRETLPLYALWDFESFIVHAKLRGDFD